MHNDLLHTHVQIEIDIKVYTRTYYTQNGKKIVHKESKGNENGHMS